MTISIITPVYNGAATIGDTLRSVREQDFPAVEHLVIDGGSRDDTAAIVAAAGSALWFSEPDQGIYDAMNKGIDKAQGDIVGILNADDFYVGKDVLSKVAELFEDPWIQAVYADLCYVSAEDPSRIVRYWKAGDFHPLRFFNGWMPPHPTFFVRRGLYEQLGGFDLRFKTAADYELMLRFLLKTAIPVAYLPQVIVHMRTGGQSNASWRQRWRANREDRMAWKVNRMQPHFWTIWLKPFRKLSQYWRRPRP